MKKILLIFALILTLSAACLAFTACGDEECAHSYLSEVTKEATCVSDGVMTYTCSLCSDSYTEAIKALGHDEVSHEAKAPTCTEKGWDAYATCSRCDYSTYAPIDKNGHSHNAIVTKPTCTEKGYTTHVCHCGDSYVDTYVDLLEHTEVTDEAVPPTCTQTGLTEGKHCSVCSTVLVRQETVAALEHNAGSVVREKEIPATCTKEGSYVEIVYCATCDSEISRATKTITKLEHTAKAAVEENRVNATCTKEGKYDEVIYCSVCNTELARETKTIDKLPHVYVNRVCECGLIELITLKELKVNIEKYVDTYVAFEGVVIFNDGNGTAYVEELDEETGEYFGMQIFYGYSLSTFGKKVLSIGNRIVVVGSVMYYEAGDTYQICNIHYDPFRPQDPNNIKLIEAGHSASYDEATVSEITTGRLIATVNEVTGERRDFDFGYLTLHSSKKLTNLTVESVYTTNNGGENDGAHSITCRDSAGNRIIIRTAVLYDDNGNRILSSYFPIGSVITEACGIIDTYGGEYHLKVFHQDNIIFK